jgi:hypothetical protein
MSAGFAGANMPSMPTCFPSHSRIAQNKPGTLTQPDFVVDFTYLDDTQKFHHMANNTIKVELLNDQALALLQQLEQLNILRLVKADDSAEAPKRQWAGSISKETASELLEYVEQSREEWERNTY